MRSSDRTSQIGNVPPGRQRLRFRAPGYAPSAIQGVDVEDSKAATRAPFERSPGGTLMGRLLTAQGTPFRVRKSTMHRWTGCTRIAIRVETIGSARSTSPPARGHFTSPGPT